MKLYTHDPKKDKLVLAGEYDDEVFYKTVKKNHFMWVEKGYGIQEDVVQHLTQLGCKEIRIIEKINNYCFSFEEVLSSRLRDYGNGPQRFLTTVNKEPMNE